MTASPPKRLRQYFQAVADGLTAGRMSSAIFPNASDAGGTREDLLHHFLERHVPSRCSVSKGGFVFDAEGRESKQIDLLVTNDAAFQFRAFAKVFACIESCYAAISVKTRLDSKELEEALANLASIPPMPQLLVSPLFERADIVAKMPYLVIFAFESVGADTVRRTLVDYYAAHPTPPYRQVQAIIVNNGFRIVRTDQVSTTNLGEILPANTFVADGAGVPQLGGYMLFWLIHTIQSAASIGPHLILNLQQYVERYFE